METKFNFKSQICTDKVQSERLLALGLKKETADMALVENWDWSEEDGKYFTGEYFERPIDYVEGLRDKWIPAWSLHRLLSLIPKEFKVNVIPMCGRNYEMPIEMHILPDLSIVYTDLSKEDYKGFYYTNIYDSLISCIEWQIEQGYFNKEYLV